MFLGTLHSTVANSGIPVIVVAALCGTPNVHLVNTYKKLEIERILVPRWARGGVSHLGRPMGSSIKAYAKNVQGIPD